MTRAIGGQIRLFMKILISPRIYPDMGGGSRLCG
jgi:hypothetical protein